MPRLRQVARPDTDDQLVQTMYDQMFGPGRDPVAEHLVVHRVHELVVGIGSRDLSQAGQLCSPRLGAPVAPSVTLTILEHLQHAR